MMPLRFGAKVGHHAEQQHNRVLARQPDVYMGMLGLTLSEDLDGPIIDPH